MVHSMTGFGRGEATGPAGRIVAEVKAVNHRFAEVVVRMPRTLSSLEDRVRKAVQARVARGRIDVFITWESAGVAARRVQVDRDLALAYHNALKDIGAAMGSNAELSAESLAKLPDVVTIQDAELDVEIVWPTVAAAVADGLAALVAMRAREGMDLVADLITRLETIDQLVQGIVGRAPAVVEEYRQRMAQRVAELLGGETLDPGRLAQEVAIYADRSDISEELQRLRSHLGQFGAILGEKSGAAADDSAAIGRKLDFLVQELNREINTVGAKAQDVEIVQSVVDVKAELEKIREQVQNIE